MVKARFYGEFIISGDFRGYVVAWYLLKMLNWSFDCYSEKFGKKKENRRA